MLIEMLATRALQPTTNASRAALKRALSAHMSYNLLAYRHEDFNQRTDYRDNLPGLPAPKAQAGPIAAASSTATAATAATATTVASLSYIIVSIILQHKTHGGQGIKMIRII